MCCHWERQFCYLGLLEDLIAYADGLDLKCLEQTYSAGLWIINSDTKKVQPTFWVAAVLKGTIVYLQNILRETRDDLMENLSQILSSEKDVS